MRTRLSFLVVLILLLAGCATVPVTLPASAPTTEPMSETESAAETRTVTHVLGSTEVPANPQRIAVLDNFALEAVLSLGITPVGAVYNEQVAQQSFMQGRLDNVENLGGVGEPNLERLLALDPDLILTINVYDDFQRTYDQLSQIAPTVPVDFESSAAWKEVFTEFAAALGREAEAQDLLAAYDARLATFREVVGDSLDETSVSIVRAYSDGSLRLYLSDSYPGVVLSDAGLKWPEAQPATGFAEDISKERIDLIEADVIFLWTANDPEGEQAIADLEVDPLWAQLTAVQNERVYAAPRYWIGSGILAANAIIDDIYAAFGVEIDEPATETETFPVTIEHKFGTVTVPTEPLRVVTLGFSEQDAVLALGMKPIAIREWFGEQPYAVWPWAQEELGDATPEVINMPFGQLNFEDLAAMQPDLIVATHSGITTEEYEILAGIAPTLAQSGEVDDFGMSWQEQTRSIGQALGRSAQAEELINQVEAQIVAAAHPSFTGKTISWITPTEAPGEFWVTGQNTPPMRFLGALGFEFPAEVAELIGDQSSLRISSERLDLIDTTVLILRAPTQEVLDAIIADPIFQQLNAVKDGRTVYFVGNDPIYGALSFSTVDSLPYVIEQLTPKLVQVTAQ